jgi:hypothetical protein
MPPDAVTLGCNADAQDARSPGDMSGQIKPVTGAYSVT